MGGGVLEGYNCDGNSKIKWRITQSSKGTTPY